MKIELCVFSGYKIQPGHGKTYTRIDGRTFVFLSGKTESLFKQRKNPRKIAWTVLYRRKHKKGISEEAVKRRTRRTQKFQRAIEGVAMDKIKELRAQKPEFRKAQRDQAVRAAKDKAKKAAKGKKSGGKGFQKTKAVKNVKSSKPNVGGKR